MSNLKEKIKAYIRRESLILPGEEITAAVSGGADSTALLILLDELAGEVPFSLRALHVHHGLRGSEADADEAFVCALCEERNIPLAVHRVDVAKLARKKGIGIEEAGRLARRGAFAQEKKVALAHHMGDQAETLLFRLARGTALPGLAGMRPREPLLFDEPDGTALIRPLLAVTREEIERELTARAQDWREDASNSDESYARNAIRRSVLPALASKINGETVPHMAAAAESIAEADAFLREEARRRGEGILRSAPSTEGEEPVEEVLLFAELAGLPEVLQGYLILEAIGQAAGTRRDIGRLHIAQVRALFDQSVGKRAELPHGLVAVRERDAVRLFVAPDLKK